MKITKRILKRSEFLQTRLVKEEFIKKFFRNITGVTDRRMDWILNNVNPLGQLEDTVGKISESQRDEYRKKLPDFLKTHGWWTEDRQIKGKENNFIRILFSKLIDSNMKTDNSPEKVDWLRGFIISCEEYDARTPLEIDNIDDQSWDNFKQAIKNINKQIQDVLDKGVDDITRNKNYELRNSMNKEIDEFIDKYSFSSSSSRINYHELENSPILNYYYPLLKKDNLGDGYDYSDFTKSLCISLKKGQFKNSDYNPVVESYQQKDVISILKYDEQFEAYLDKNIDELERFIEISRSISELELEKINTQTKKEDINKKIGELENKLDETSIRELKNKYEKLQNIYDELHSSWNKVMQNFKKISEHIKEKKVSEIIKFKNPINFIKMEVTDKDTQNKIDYSDKIYKCGNVVYHGGTVPNLEQEGELEKFIEKKGKYKENLSGKGIYCCHVMKDVLSYPIGRTLEFSRNFPDACPTVYKLTLRKGSLFFYTEHGDTLMEPQEIENLKALKLCGVHSGTKLVNGPGTTEISIITPECVEKVEKLSLDQMKDIIDDEKKIFSHVSRPEDIERLLGVYKNYQEKNRFFRKP